MSRPPNVVDSNALPWEPDGAEPPFGTTCRELHGRVTLRDLGMHLETVAPGRRSCPLHDHLLEEEVFYVLEGQLTVLERTPDGRRRRFVLHAGELVAYPPGTRIAHCFANTSALPARFVALSDRRPGDVCTYPDSGKTLLRTSRLLGVWQGRAPGTPPRAATTTIAEARARAAAEPVVDLADADRPPHVTGGRERAVGAEGGQWFGTPLSRPAGATRVFVHRDRLPPGVHPSPLHQHDANEEILYLLSGALDLDQADPEGRTRTRLAPGDLVHWAPGGVAHQITNPGVSDAVYLLIGTDLPWDVTTFPDRGERYVALLDEVGTMDPHPYWEGEQDPAPGAGRG